MRFQNKSVNKISLDFKKSANQMKIIRKKNSSIDSIKFRKKNF